MNKIPPPADAAIMMILVESFGEPNVEIKQIAKKKNLILVSSLI